MHDSKKLMAKMKKKGWSDEEIEHATLAMQEPRRKIIDPFYDRFLHWIVFLSMLIGNFVIIFYLIPLIFILKSAISYVIIGFIAVVMGKIFEVVISDITHLNRKHNFVVGVVLPFLSLGIFVGFLSMLAETFEITGLNIMVVGLIYSVMFVAPFYIKKMMDYLDD
jgi:hypothetical protein